MGVLSGPVCSLRSAVWAEVAQPLPVRTVHGTLQSLAWEAMGQTRPAHTTCSRDRRGLGVVEGVLAVLLAAVAVLALAGAFRQGALGTEQVLRYTRAVQAAAAELERVEAFPFRVLEAWPETQGPRSFPPPPGCRLVLTKETLRPGEVLRISAEVSWELRPGLTQSVRLSKLLLEEVP